MKKKTMESKIEWKIQMDVVYSEATRRIVDNGEELEYILYIEGGWDARWGGGGQGVPGWREYSLQSRLETLSNLFLLSC